MDAHNDIKGVLLDLDGVFYVGERAIEGGQASLQWLREHAIPFRFITNTTTRSPASLLEKLEKFGLHAKASDVFTAVSATVSYLENAGANSVHLLVRDEVKPAFKAFKQSDSPDFVVIGDIGARWHYDELNQVFNMLMEGATLLTMHKNKYWQGENGLLMDIGAFVAALEYVSGQEAIVVGKPNGAFFSLACQSMGLANHDVAIIGDDIESDIGGGRTAGLRSALVKTGKYRARTLAETKVRPDWVIDSIADIHTLFSI